MKNLKSILKKTALALVFATSLGLSKQVDEEHFTKVGFCSEEGETPSSCENGWDESSSVCARAFINENLEAEINYRDLDNDGKFDYINYFIKKNDFISLKETILFDHSKKENYIKEYVSGRSYLKDDGMHPWQFFEPENAIKEIRNMPLEEIALKERERILEIMNLKKDRETIINFLEKEYEEKNDALNPNSPNTTYNQIERVSKIPGGLDKIKENNLEKDNYVEFEFMRCENTYKKKSALPMKTRMTGSKKGVDYVYFGNEWNLRDDACKIITKEIDSYYLLNVVNFTNNHEVIIETVKESDNRENINYDQDLTYIRKIYKIDRKGHAERLKDDLRDVNSFSEGAKPSDFSPKDRERIKEIMNCYKTESLLKDFIQKEYERNN